MWGVNPEPEDGGTEPAQSPPPSQSAPDQNPEDSGL
ncbi:MAG: hypothetical protein ACI8X5_003213, partial [Planctomycetota bacterium]